MNGPGLFITLEGGEGSGKTTQVRMLSRRLEAMGLNPVLTRQPGGTVVGSRIRDLLIRPVDEGFNPMAELMLYLADRAQHVAKLIAPALTKGQVVVCDRFADSSEVYQGRARGLGFDLVRQLNRQVCGDIWPDLTLVLDVDPQDGLARARDRQGDLGLDRLEREELEFHLAVRQGFLDQAAQEPERMRVIDASEPQDQVAEEVWNQVALLVSDWRLEGGGA